MQKLQCELCGSVDIVRGDDGFFHCEHCGCKYTLEQAKALLGTVETTIGTAELERLLKNAKTQYDIGEFSEAENTYTQVTKQFPDDYRGWLGLLRVSYRQYANYIFRFNSVKKMVEWYKICQRLAPPDKERIEVDREWTEYWDTGAALLRSGKLCNYERDIDIFKYTSPAMYDYMKCGVENAKILNELHAAYSDEKNQWILDSLALYHYTFWLGRALGKSYHNYTDDSFRTPDIVLPPIDDAYMAKIKSDIQRYSAEMLSHNKCPYCREFLQGVFGKKCPRCDRKF